MTFHFVYYDKIVHVKIQYINNMKINTQLQIIHEIVV
jgi:hypothetical protein